MGLVTSSGAAAVRHFLAPASIAVVGASTDETSVSGRPLTLVSPTALSGRTIAAAPMVL